MNQLFLILQWCKFVGLNKIIANLWLIFYHNRLWANVTNCPSSNCSCYVTNNITETNRLPVVFLQNISLGSVNVINLQPVTIYWFTLTCEGALSPVERQIETDVGRPSAPREIKVSLNRQRLSITWLAPSNPAGPIDNYRLIYDRQRSTNFSVSPDALYFDLDEDYVSGTTITHFLLACNTNSKEQSICSDANDGKFSYSNSINTSTTTKATSKGSKSLANISNLSLFLCFIVFIK